MALEKETKRQSELVLEERVRWRETLKGQRREMVERCVDERRLLTTRTTQRLANGHIYKPHSNDNDNIHSDHSYDRHKRLEYEKFLDRNIFGHANDNEEVEDYGYYLETRRENKPLTGILSKFIQDPKQLIKKVKSEDDSSPLDSPIVMNDEIDNQGTFKLIDALFLLGPHDDDVNRICLLNPLSTVTERVEPHILFECGSVPGVETEVLPFFSFPSGVEVTTSATSKRPTKSFVFVLASHTYSQYAICMVVPRTFKDPANPSSNRLITTEYSICVVTRLPFISYLTHILHRSDLMGWIFPSLKEPIQARDSPQDIILPVLYSLNDLANRLRRMKVLFEIPEDPIVEADDCLLKYDSVEFTLPWRSIDGVNQMKNRDTFILPRDKHAELFYTQIQSRVEIMQVQRPLIDRENTFYTLMWSLPILLKHLPLEEIMLVLGCALTEMRVIIHAPDLHVVSGCLLALANLLRPLKWAGVIIVTLPSSSLYMNYLESPVPMIVGMQQLPSDFQLKDGTVIVDPLHNAAHKAVQLHSKDVVESHTLTLPHTAVLIKNLKDQAENILRTAKKYNRMAYATDEDARNSNYKPPIELDATTDDGQLFLSSVSAFVSILETHLTTVVNTAVFLTREQSRQQKMKANIGKTESIDSFRKKASVDLMDDHSDIGDTHSDAGDNKSQISIASDESEALPPMEKDAPRLNTRGQNDSHLLFVRRLMATQMFEDYCHVASETHKKAVIRAKISKLDSSKSKLADSNQDVASQRNPVRRYSTDANGMSLKNVFNNNDSLISLFITILSGSTPITEEQLQYMNDSINENENIEVQHRDVFCNGRCGGMANSPLCTSLCVTLWEQQVYRESQKQKMQELLIKHRNSQFVIVRKKLLKAVPRIRPIQHPRETDSQYEKRCGTVFKNINNETMNISALEGDADYESNPKVSTALKQLSKYFVNRELSRIARNKRREELELRNRELRELCAIKIQAIARGYFVRFDTLKLFNRLVEAKLSVLGSKIKARNIIRKAMARRQLWLVRAILDDFKQERAASPIVGPIGIKSPTSSIKKIHNVPYEIAASKPSIVNNDKSNRSLQNQTSSNKEKSKTLHLGERATGALSKFFRSVFPEAQTSNSSNSRSIDKKSKSVLVETAPVDTKKSATIPLKADLSTHSKRADSKLTVAPHSSVDIKNESSPGSDDSQTVSINFLLIVSYLSLLLILEADMERYQQS